MFINSAMSFPTSSDEPLRVELSSQAPVNWHMHPAQDWEDAGDAFGMHYSSKMASARRFRHAGLRMEAESQETGSNASTADTQPYLGDVGFYADPWNVAGQDMPWSGYGASSWREMPTFTDVAQPVLQTEGSGDHHLGRCKPCAFAWRPEGCQSGSDCKFCHLCPPGEKQRRKRVLRSMQRNAGLRTR